MWPLAAVDKATTFRGQAAFPVFPALYQPTLPGFSDSRFIARFRLLRGPCGPMLASRAYVHVVETNGPCHLVSSKKGKEREKPLKLFFQNNCVVPPRGFMTTIPFDPALLTLRGGWCDTHLGSECMVHNDTNVTSPSGVALIRPASWPTENTGTGT